MNAEERQRLWMKDYYSDGARGLRDLLEKTSTYTNQIPLKLDGMQTRYLVGNEAQYNARQRANLVHYLDAFLYKEFSCDWLTEQIWSLARTSDAHPLLLEVLQNSYDSQSTRDINTVANSLLLDNFLVQAAAFLDFYILYLWNFFKQEQKDRGFIKWDDLKNRLQSVQDPSLVDKAPAILTYLDSRVFATEKALVWKSLEIQGWGTIVNSLRNKVVHRDRSLPDFSIGESLTSTLSEGWPEELKAIEVAAFCEAVRAEMFGLVSALAAVLYDEPWKPGPAVDPMGQ